MSQHHTLMLFRHVKLPQKYKGAYRITFLIKRKKASLEDVQKFFPYIAIYLEQKK